MFIYACADITVNHGASLRGWASLVARVVKSVSAIG
jgi:hypothetical protein